MPVLETVKGRDHVEGRVFERKRLPDDIHLTAVQIVRGDEILQVGSREDLMCVAVGDGDPIAETGTDHAEGRVPASDVQQRRPHVPHERRMLEQSAPIDPDPGAVEIRRPPATDGQARRAPRGQRRRRQVCDRARR